MVENFRNKKITMKSSLKIENEGRYDYSEDYFAKVHGMKSFIFTYYIVTSSKVASCQVNPKQTLNKFSLDSSSRYRVSSIRL